MRITLFLLMISCLCSGQACGTRGSNQHAPAEWRLVSQGGESSDDVSIMSISFADVNHGWMITLFGLFETIDGGQTWSTRLNAGSSGKAFYSMAFVSPTVGVVVGTKKIGKDYAPLIFISIDSGKSWQERETGAGTESDIGKSIQLHGLSFCNPSVGWAVGSGLVLRTNDSGQTWERITTKQPGIFFSTACVDPQNAYIVGQGGVIMHTGDGGKDWERLNSGTTDNLNRVRFFGKTGWIVGGNAGRGFVLRSDDGTDWERVRFDSSEVLIDIYMNGQEGWIVGAMGTILHTIDGGVNWEKRGSPTENDLTSLFFLSPDEGWAVGANRTVLRFSK